MSATQRNLGGYEPIGELSLTARATVHLADAASGTAGVPPASSADAHAPGFALKVYHTDSAAGPRRHALLLAFKAAADAQAAAHAKNPARWAAVRASGIVPGRQAAFLVTDYYPRTLARVIDARLAFDLPAIYALTAAIIDGLAALDAAADRPHGALTPGNIYISGTGTLRKSAIHLTEPAPLSGITPQQARAADHRALGAIIATLIRRRPHTGWPIEDGPEWTFLGKHKRAWLDFCNYLLDPNPPADTCTLAELQRRFALLGGRGMRTRTKIAIPVAALLVLLSPFAALRFAPFEKIPESLQEFAIQLGNMPPDVEEVPAEFALLCDIWYEWFGSLCAETYPKENEPSPLWTADTWLHENVLAHTAPAARDHLDPRKLTEDDRNFENLRAEPPASAKRGIVVRRIKQAHATLTKLAESFVDWPGQKNIADSADRLEKLGFAAATAELRSPELAYLPSINSGRLPPELTRRLKLLEAAAAAERAWAATAARLDLLDSTNDPVLRGVRTREQKRAATTPLAELPAKLAETAPALDVLVNFINTDWASRIGRERWLAESFVRDFNAAATPVDDTTLKRWNTEIANYYIVTPAEDPRLAPDLETTLAPTTETALRTITNEEASLGGGTPVATALAQENTALRADLAAFKASQVLRKDIPAAREKNTALQTRYTTFAAKIAAAMDELRPVPAEWLARMRAANVGPSAVLNAEWARRRDALLSGVTPEQLAASDTNFRALRSRVRQVREFLAELDGPKIAGSIKPLELGKISEPYPTEAKTADAAQKETLLADLLAQSQWNADGTPALAPDDFAKAAPVRARVNALAAWREAAAKLIEDIINIETLTQRGFAWDEAPAENAETLNTIYARAVTNIATPAITASGRSASVFAESRLLQTLQTEINRATLIRTATSSASLSVPLTAWQRLDALTDWPATVEELDRELALEKNLTERIEKSPGLNYTMGSASFAPDDPREKEFVDYLAALKARRLALVTAAAPQRWRRGYAQIDVARTNDVITRMPQFGVKPEDLTGLDRFDYLLNQARQTRWARLSETDARDQRNAFVAAARAALSANSGLEKFLADTQAINLEPTGEKTTPADIGPGRLGWNGEFSEDLNAITYRWTDPRGTEHVQQYRLVEPNDGVPFFLSTRAVSVGEFISLVEAKTEGREVIAAMPPWMADVSAGTDSDFRPGPQTWRVLVGPPRRGTPTRLNDSRMTLNKDRWQVFVDPRWPEPYYAPGITPPAPPTADSPMQNLPPNAARLFAEKILGARLPTAEEWNGVAQLYAPTLAKPGAPGANFSDATWLAQRDYLVKNGGLFEHPWPDSGAFTPPGQPAPTAQSHATAPAFAAQSDDKTLWFANVSTNPAPSGFSHLFGNVATFLYSPLAPAREQYAVAGGSAISTAAINPATVYPVSGDSEGFADVGLRPAFDASKVMIIRGQLMMLLRKQEFARQKNSKNTTP